MHGAFMKEEHERPQASFQRYPCVSAAITSETNLEQFSTAEISTASHSSRSSAWEAWHSGFHANLALREKRQQKFSKNLVRPASQVYSPVAWASEARPPERGGMKVAWPSEARPPERGGMKAQQRQDHTSSRGRLRVPFSFKINCTASEVMLSFTARNWGSLSPELSPLQQNSS